MTEVSQRLFIAIPLPPELKEILADRQEYLRARLPGLRVSWLKKEQMHLTVLFLGDTASTKIDGIVLSIQNNVNSASFRLSMGGLGIFPNFKRPRVIWVGLGGDLKSLHGLHEEVATSLSEISFDRRKLKPHLTLGRVRRGSEPNMMHTFSEAKRTEYSWSVESFHLYKSDLRPEGAVHSILATFELNNKVDDN